MPHIQYATGKWINTDNIETVEHEIIEVRRPSSSSHIGTMVEQPQVSIIMVSRQAVLLRADSATTFLAEYQRLCVAQQRPEVG